MEEVPGCEINRYGKIRTVQNDQSVPQNRHHDFILDKSQNKLDIALEIDPKSADNPLFQLNLLLLIFQCLWESMAYSFV